MVRLIRLTCLVPLVVLSLNVTLVISIEMVKLISLQMCIFLVIS